MAEASPDPTNGSRCVGCLRNSEDAEDLKILPCEHVHCQDCLTKYDKRNRSLRCLLKACGSV